ncbi:MAG: hypothetical protein ACJ764_04235 [Solirubrobacteraceae bacterium]
MKRIASSFSLVGAGVILLTLLPTLAPARAQKSPHVCQGTADKPGVLAGRFANGVEVKGYCAVNSGPAHVIGTLRVTAGSTLLAAYGMHKSKLSVRGDIKAGRRATLVLGCSTTESACFDDPDMSHPTLNSFPTVTGDVTSNRPLGVIVHSTTIGGDVSQTGGGGGLTCQPKGPFAAFQSPVYSAYEDSTISGDLSVTGVISCWMGVIRNHVHNVSLNNNKLSDDDAIEVESNHVRGNLGCAGNSHVWDSSETTETGLYPRALHRNHVRGKRFGQCRKAGPLTEGGPPAGGPF